MPVSSGGAAMSSWPGTAPENSESRLVPLGLLTQLLNFLVERRFCSGVGKILAVVD